MSRHEHRQTCRLRRGGPDWYRLGGGCGQGDGWELYFEDYPSWVDLQELQAAIALRGAGLIHSVEVVLQPNHEEEEYSHG